MVKRSKKRKHVKIIIHSKEAKAFVKKLRKKKVKDYIIGKGVLWAINYAKGLAKMIADSPSEYDRMMKKIMPKAYEKAEKWVEGVSE